MVKIEFLPQVTSRAGDPSEKRGNREGQKTKIMAPVANV